MKNKSTPPLLKLIAIVLIGLTFTTSCVEDLKKNVIRLGNNESGKQLLGSYEFLEDTGVNIFVPEGFERISFAEYAVVVEEILEKQEAQYALRYIDELKKNKGTVYLFLERESRSTIIANTIPYMPFNREDAQMLLGMMTMNNDKVAVKTKLVFKKLTAKYNHMEGHDIFKSVYKIVDKAKKGGTWYNNSYIISANDKSIYLQLTTGNEVDFDPFVLKTKM